MDVFTRNRYELPKGRGIRSNNPPGTNSRAVTILRGQVMQRSTGLFLLAVGCLFILLGVVGLVTAVADAPAWGMLWVLVGLLAAGGVLVALAVRVMAGARPIGTAPKVIDGRAGNYLADAAEARRYAGRTYEVYYRAPTKGKNARPSQLAVRVEAPTPTTLQFNEETWFDRLCKRIGIAREHQTGDRGFDAAVYVRGPSDGYAEEYLEDRDKRAAILELRRLGFREVRLTGEHVEALWPRFDPAADDRPDLTDEAVARLFVLARDLPARHARHATHGLPSKAARSAALWAVAITYAVLFLFVFVYPPVHESSLIAAALALFVPAYLLLGWVSAYLLRGTSTSHDRWAKLMSVGVLLVGLGSAGAVAAVNGLADSAPPDERSLSVSDKRISTGKRGRKTYYATVPAWDRPGGTLEFRVGAAEYGTIAPGRSAIELTTGRGALGIAWVKSKHVRP